jgi:sugar phosphate permease
MGQDAGMRMLLPVGRSGWAIAAGYLGLFAFIILPAPLAVIISIVAIIDIRKHPEKHGMGRAIFGLIAGLLGSAVLAMGIVANLVRHH